MVNKSESLIERLYSFRKALYIPIAAAALTLTSYSPINSQSQKPINNENKALEINEKSKSSGLEIILNNKIESGIYNAFKEKDYVNVIVELYEGDFFPEDLEFSKLLVKEKQDSVLSGLSGSFKLKHQYKTIYSFAGEINKNGLEKLSENDNVEFIYMDKILQPNLTQSVPLINADDVHKTIVDSINIRGNGQVIAIIDDGIDYTHPDLGGCLGENCKVIGGYDFIDGDADPKDELGHGTIVAGIAAANGRLKGVAPDAKLVGLKVCNELGCFSSAILAGADWCIDNKSDLGISVINMSLGFASYDSTNCPIWMDSVINRAYDMNMPFTIGSGNGGFKDAISDPACSPKTISVGAVYDANVGLAIVCLNSDCTKTCTDSITSADKITCYSNSADILDLLAPGDLIESTSINGEYFNGGGTSAAAPHVAGTIALMKQVNPSLSVGDIDEILKKTGVPVMDDGNGMTFPRIDALAAVACSLEGDKIDNSIVCPNRFVRGDANRDNVVDISDPIKTIFYLYSGARLNCLDAADSNDDGKIDVADSIFSLNYLFKQGAIPGLPHPRKGYDFTLDDLRCIE